MWMRSRAGLKYIIFSTGNAMYVIKWIPLPNWRPYVKHRNTYFMVSYHLFRCLAQFSNVAVEIIWARDIHTQSKWAHCYVHCNICQTHRCFQWGEIISEFKGALPSLDPWQVPPQVSRWYLFHKNVYEF